MPDSEAVGIYSLARQIEQGIISGEMPQLADSMHHLHDIWMTSYLDLRAGPEQAKVLRVVLGEPYNLGVPLGVTPELRLPRRCHFFRNYAADDNATSLPGVVRNIFWEKAAVALQISEIDLWN